jgi:hypothetical protein
MAESQCAFCRLRAVDPVWRPFCSERCKIQDLARWVDGAYRVPGEARAPTADTGENEELETGK